MGAGDVGFRGFRLSRRSEDLAGREDVDLRRFGREARMVTPIRIEEGYLPRVIFTIPGLIDRRR
jgi:hypothetical protein